MRSSSGRVARGPWHDISSAFLTASGSPASSMKWRSWGQSGFGSCGSWPAGPQPRMTARASFTLCLALASRPLAAGLFGVYQLWTLRAVDLDAAALAEFCLIAYERTVDTAGHVVIYAAIGLLLFLLACGLVAIFRGWRETRRITRLPPASTESAKWATVQQFGARHLPRRRIELFAAPEPMAITVGYVSPRILLSSGLLDVLDESELEAVLHHEAAPVG